MKRRRPAGPVKSPSISRRLAFEAITAAEKSDLFLKQSLDELCAEFDVAGPDRGLAMEIANGVMRRQLTLDAVLQAYCDRPLENIEAEVRSILHIGLYQLLFLDRVPPHAAVDETVRLCHFYERGLASGFVNGILRSVVRELPAEAIEISDRSQFDQFTVPIVQCWEPRQLRGLVFPRPLFFTPENDFPGYVSAALSQPRWIIDRWNQVLSADAIWQRALWFATAGTLHLRVNLLRATRADCLEALAASGIRATVGQLAESIQVSSSLSLESLPQFQEGWFSVQDESAMQAVHLLSPQPGEKVLDLCAAPGGKTTFLAERMRNEGSVLGADSSPQRLTRVIENRDRLGLSIIECQVLSEQSSAWKQQLFDAVLVDVPCSNTGVLGKRPEARWRLKPPSIRELVILQQQLLKTALAAARPGGRVLYSTCSCEAEENEELVRSVLAEQATNSLVTEQRWEPGQGSDGAYQALIRVSGPLIA